MGNYPSVRLVTNALVKGTGRQLTENPVFADYDQL